MILKAHINVGMREQNFRVVSFLIEQKLRKSCTGKREKVVVSASFRMCVVERLGLVSLMTFSIFFFLSKVSPSI